MSENDSIENRFNYHPPLTEIKREAHNVIRAELLGVAKRLSDLISEPRERALFVTKLEEAMFWGNAGIARVDDDAFAKYCEWMSIRIVDGELTRDGARIKTA